MISPNICLVGLGLFIAVSFFRGCVSLPLEERSVGAPQIALTRTGRSPTPMSPAVRTQAPTVGPLPDDVTDKVDDRASNKERAKDGVDLREKPSEHH